MFRNNQLLYENYLYKSLQADSDDKMKVENGSDDIISEEKKKPKTKTKTVQNPLEVTISKKGFTAKELQEAVERENAMVSCSQHIQIFANIFQVF